MLKRILNQLFIYRFELFFVSLIFTLFGSLVVPKHLFEGYLFTFSLFVNMGAGIMLFLKRRRLVVLMSLLIGVLFLLSVVHGVSEERIFSIVYSRYLLFGLFYSAISLELILQVWRAEDVSANIILGMMSGFICIGLIAHFSFIAIEFLNPGSFHGIPAELHAFDKSRQLLNFSFITLLTVGYGDIAPASFPAQKMAVLTAMMGQFYLVIITAVVIGKFLMRKK